ncbi:MAG: putative metalloprotease CJM1_0395 family protein [Marinagarivorans sp.]
MLSFNASPSLPSQPAAYPQVGQIPVGLESSSQRLQRIRPVEHTPAAAPSGKEKREPGAIGQKGVPLEPVSDQDKRKQARQAAEEKIAQAELAQLKQLSARDREVRAHEQAHKAVAGSYGGAIHYEYERGPDGNRYAVGGEVSIDTAPESSPEATLAKARVIQRAASAPAEPSDQDRAVAAEASQMEQQALQQLAQERLDAHSQGEPSNSTSHDGAARKVGADESAPGGPVDKPAGAPLDASAAAKTQAQPAAADAGALRRLSSSHAQTPSPYAQTPSSYAQRLSPYVQTAASLHFHVQA